MSHQFESGVFLHGQPAWHGLGHVLDKTLPAREAFRLANADFSVSACSVFSGGDGEFNAIDGYKAIIRDDTRQVLSVMTDRYHPIQNEQLILMAEALRENVEMDAVCVLNEGRKVTFTGKINGVAGAIGKEDECHQYVVGATSHDGSVSFSLMFSPVRVVCNNTLSEALSRADQELQVNRLRINRVRHSRTAIEMIRRLPELMDFSARRFTTTIEEYQAMAATPFLEREFRTFCEQLYADQLRKPINDKRGDSSSARPRVLEDLPQWESLQAKFNGEAIGGELPHVRGTVFGAYNAVSEYLSHEIGRSNDPIEAARQRLDSLWFGPASKRLATAHLYALEATRA